MANLSRSVILNILGINKSAKDAIDETNKGADEIEARNPILHIGAEIKKALEGIGILKGALEDIQKRVDTPVGLDISPAITDAATLKGILRGMSEKVTTLYANLDSNVIAQVDNIIARMEFLGHMIENPKVDLSAGEVIAKIEAIKSAIDSIKGRTLRLGLDAGPLGLAAVDQAFAKLKSDASQAFDAIQFGAERQAVPAMQDTHHSILDTIIAATAMNNMVHVGTGAWGAWGTKIELFGGLLSAIGIPKMLATVGVVHILADAILEVGAVLIPATIAFGAYAAAASQGVQDITTRMRSLLVVTDATSRPVGILTGGFLKLQNAVEPSTLELFGEGLNIINSHTGTLTRLVSGATGVIENLAARFTLATGAGSTFGNIIANHAVPDLAKIGTLIGNVGGIIGNVLRQLPGYAEVLLTIAVAVTGFVEKLTAMFGWVIKLGLALHGFLLWVGLAVTGLVLLGRVIISTLIPGLISGLSFVVNFTRGLLGMEYAAAGASAAAKGAFLSMVLTNPITWIVGAVAALGALVIIWNKVDGGAKAAINAMEAGLSGLSAAQAIPRINQDIGNLQLQMVGAQKGAKGFIDEMKMLPGAIGGLLSGNFKEFGALWSSVTNGNAAREFQGAIVNLTHSQDNLLKSTGGLIREGYTYSQALGIMDLAGVRANDSFAVMQVKIAGLIKGFASMGVKAGALNAAVNAVDLQMQQQQSKVQTLTQAYSNFISLVSGSETALVSFAQGLKQQYTQANAAHASMNGLNSSSLTLRSTFQGNITSATNLYNALVLQAAASGNGAKSSRQLSQAGKDLIGTMLAQARGSKEATAQLFALAQLAGFKGPDSFKALSNWVGNTTHSESNLNHITAELTRSSANLTTDVKNLANSLQENLNTAMSAAIFQANGGQRAFDRFANSVIHAHGEVNPGLTSAADALIKELIATTQNTTAAHNEFLTFSTALHLNRDQADQLWASYVHGHDVTGTLNNIFNFFKGVIGDVRSSISEYSDAIIRMDQKLYHSGATTNQVADYNRRLLGPSLSNSAQTAYKLAVAAENAGNKLKGIPSRVPVSIIETGIGKFVESITAKVGKIFSNSSLFTGAKGFRVPGTGHEDNFPALLMPGEAVVPTHLVPAIAPFLGRHHVPGFEGHANAADHANSPGIPWHAWKHARHMASGGVAGGPNVLPMVTDWEVNKVSSFATFATDNFVKNIINTINKAAKASQAAAFSGSTPNSGNYLMIARWLMTRGLTRAAAAGIAGTVAGESGGNPESVGSGGAGLIGWTPPSSAYPIRNIVTGHPQRDMQVQLVDLMAYLERNGSIANMNSFSNPLAAAENWSARYERPAVRFSDIRANIVEAVYRELGGAQASKQKHLWGGGVIGEPVIGLGLHSGTSYSFGERGPELVTPMNGNRRGAGSPSILIMVNGDTDPDGAALRIWQKLKDYRRHHGGVPLKLG